MTIEIKDGASAQKYLKSSGAGTSGDPYIAEHKETSAAAILAAVTGVATAAAQATLLTELQAKADLTETQPVSAASLPLPSGAATAANQTTIIGHVDGIETLLTTIDGHVDGIEGLQTAEATLIGAVTETAPATDTASSGLNGRLQRIAQRLTSLIALIPAALTGSGNFKVAVQEALPAGTNTIGGTLDAGIAATTSQGVSSAVVTSSDATTPVALTAAPTSGQKLVIWDIIASSDTEMWLEFEEETSGTILFKVYMAANTTVQITPRGKVKLPVADKKLMVDAEAAGNIAVTCIYSSEA